MIEQWEKTLNIFQNDLDKVVVVVSGESTKEHIKALENFNAGSVPFEILYRPNFHGSYGAWKFAWETFKDQYNWYFVFEDDYRPNISNWDSIFLESTRGGFAYVGGLIMESGGKCHMAISNGVLHEKALASVRIDELSSEIYSVDLQIGFSQHIIKAGFKIKDISGEYQFPFRESNEIIHNYGNPDGVCLSVPMTYPWIL